MVKVEKTKENLKKCDCIKCPSYNLGCKLKSMPKSIMTMIKGDFANVDNFEGLFCDG